VVTPESLAGVVDFEVVTGVVDFEVVTGVVDFEVEDVGVFDLEAHGELQEET